MRAPVSEHLVVPTEHSYGDLLPEPGNATRPEPIDVVSKWLRDRVSSLYKIYTETSKPNKHVHSRGMSRG